MDLEQSTQLVKEAIPGLLPEMVMKVAAQTASPNGPVVNCAACTCDAYGEGIKHRMSEGRCVRIWLDYLSPEKRRDVFLHLTMVSATAMDVVVEYEALTERSGSSAPHSASIDRLRGLVFPDR